MSIKTAIKYAAGFAERLYLARENRFAAKPLLADMAGVIMATALMLNVTSISDAARECNAAFDASAQGVAPKVVASTDPSPIRNDFVAGVSFPTPTPNA